MENQLSEIEINYKSKVKVSELAKIVNSKDAEKYFRSVWSDKMDYIEESFILLLNRANKALGYTRISIGGTSGTVVDLKMIFQVALKANAHSFLLAHNHPSHNLNPSDQDIKLTQELSAAGKIMNIALLDHIIMTGEGYYSFADEGRMH